MGTIKLVVFDLGNVIVNFDHNIAAARMAKRCRMPQKQICGMFFDSPIVRKMDEGRISPGEFYKAVKKTLKADVSFGEFRDIWNDIFSPNRPMIAFAGKLKKKYRVFLLSNTNYMHFNFIKRKFRISGIFDRIILSYKVGKAKPHPKIYRYLIRASGLSPEEIVYIDDRPELIEGASRLGIAGIAFKGIQPLKKRLRELGVFL